MSAPQKFHVRRSIVKDEEELTQCNGIRSTRWERPKDGNSVLEVQTTHSPTALQKIPADQNYMNPPYHWHWYQEEHFTVKEGRFIFTLEGKDVIKTASDPQPIRIPPRAKHTFKADVTYDGRCTILIETKVSPRAKPGDPESEGTNEKFFRNLYTYLDDCWAQGKSPAIPQLLLFLHSAEVSLALPGPRWLSHPISYALGLVIGCWFGQYVLGYKASYPEYYDESRDSRKDK